MKEKYRREQVDPDHLNLITMLIDNMAEGSPNFLDCILKVLPELSNIYLPDYPPIKQQCSNGHARVPPAPTRDCSLFIQCRVSAIKNIFSRKEALHCVSRVNYII